jgi:hypothetical protein
MQVAMVNKMRLFELIFDHTTAQRTINLTEWISKFSRGVTFFNLIAMLLGLPCLSFNAYAITGIFPSQHPPVEVLPLSIAHRINLTQAIDMALKTELGQQFKPDIAELATQGKIRLTALNELHYGESGEGCIIRDGQYYYEGFFIVLNEKLSIPELASTLIHETDHYRQLKRIDSEKSAAPVKIGWLEKSAFATQLNFIEALENQGLSNRKALFVSRRKQIFDVMTAAQEANRKPSELTNATAIRKLLELGYPVKELERTLVVKDPAHCNGATVSDNAQSVR